jgi:hypothetical protein
MLALRLGQRFQAGPEVPQEASRYFLVLEAHARALSLTLCTR